MRATPVAPAKVPPATGLPASAAGELAALHTMAGTPIDPDQAIDARHVDARVRWAGAVLQHVPSERSVCLTMLHARSNDNGMPDWGADPTGHLFRAYASGSYDPNIVAEHTNLTIVGTVTGKVRIGLGGETRVVPMVQIERLYRWSDCLSDDASPICRSGFLAPAPATGGS